MDVNMGVNLFFSPKQVDKVTGKKYTTKHHVMNKLGIHIYFGDSDTDMIAASIAGVRAVRVVRHQASVESYGKNYFGNTMAPASPGAPFDSLHYTQFLQQSVGPYGETIYPVYFRLPSEE